MKIMLGGLVALLRNGAAAAPAAAFRKDLLNTRDNLV